MKSFESWDAQDLHFTFGVEDVEMLPQLVEWVAYQIAVEDKILAEWERFTANE